MALIPTIKGPSLSCPAMLRLPTIALFVLLFMASFWHQGECSIPPFPFARPAIADETATARAASADNSSLLRVIEVDPPVRFADQSSSAGACQQTLVTHSFAYSYGIPYVGPYTPPSCQFNRVIWNLTVVSAGRQFDRLGTVWLGDVELFRTSTAEPTQNGIIWTYSKDMSNYLPLFKKQQTIIFDLGNLINSVYTAAYNVTLTATYYNVNDQTSAADIILPLSRGLTNASSAFSFPSQNATSAFTIPNNSVKAIFTIAATGQSDEEFWWSNVLQQDVNDFPALGTAPGYSPFREVQLFIDGSLAGVVWPFPVIFTGGVVPGLWRPIVGIEAFDLREDEIDVTAWLPYLCDGKQHEYSIKVSGLVLNADGTTVLSETVDSYWILSGKLFLWLNTSSEQTVGSQTAHTNPPPSIQATSQFQNSSNPNVTALNYQVTVTRSLSISGTLHTSNGNEQAAWQQTLQYHSVGSYTQGGNLQYNSLQITGHDSSSSGYSRSISYPLNATTSSTTSGDNLTLTATVDRGRQVEIFGPSVFPTGLESFNGIENGSGSLLYTIQNGQATYIANTTASTSFSFGETDQQLTFSGVSVGGGAQTELYYRSVKAVNGTITEDQITDEGQTVQPQNWLPATEEDLYGFALVGQGMLGEDSNSDWA